MGGISHAHLNMTYQEHCKRKEALLYTTYIRRNGAGYRLVKGKLIPEEQFQRMNALLIRCYLSKENPCRKGQYLDV